jgi:hypothetical protein
MGLEGEDYEERDKAQNRNNTSDANFVFQEASYKHYLLKYHK